MKHALIVVLAAISIMASAQQKNVFPVWSYNHRNVNIHGVSVGLGSWRGEPRNTNTNGIKIELIGLGIALPLAPSNPLSRNDSAFSIRMSEPVSEKINGIVISASGTVCDCITNGVSLGYIGQLNLKVNGVSASTFMNFAKVHNGVQTAIIGNESYKMSVVQLGAFNNSTYATGLQIGLVNSSKNLKGLQVGIWNINQRRKLPLMNWNFW